MEDVSARRFQARFAATGSLICEMDFPTEHKIRVSQIVSRLQDFQAIGRRADVKLVHGANPLEGSTCLWNPQAPKAKPMRRCRASSRKPRFGSRSTASLCVVARVLEQSAKEKDSNVFSQQGHVSL